MSTAKWYVVQVYSGFEQKIADNIMEQATKKGLQEDIEDILVPTEEVTEVKRGQRVNVEKRVFPGYLLVRTVMSDAIWHMIKNIDKVSGFLGGGRKPVPISEREAEKMIAQLQEGADSGARSTLMFDVGEELRVTDGPFASFTGIVEEVDEDKQRLKVSVSIFGRATPVELEYTQVEKI